jgi:hypothetical protein
MSHSFFVRIAIGFALTLMGCIVGARTLPAFIGHPAEPDTQGCFIRLTEQSGIYATGGIANGCSGPDLNWEVPLVVDYPGYKRIIVRGHSGAGGTLFCVASSFDATGVRDALGSEYFPSNVIDQIVAVSFNFNVPAGGTASVLCTVPGGAVIHSIDYAP